jgi:serine/threonine protein kinase
MPIESGTTLGHYVIQSLIAAGGMGEIYKARDPRLNRMVAIKVLPQHIADMPERKQRFEREAQAIAALNHPHICVVYDVGHDNGLDFLVMEYLEGETLASRIAKGPIPFDQLLTYATQIADALDKAHRQGITHRDLKPGNIMITKSGVKLLDFGLAKLQQPAAAPQAFSSLPTAVNDGPPLTADGMILGTLQYMSPEQLEGKEADTRSDIFAFGTTIYETATGRRPFEGKSQVSLMAAILEHEPPPVSTLQPVAPPLFDEIIKFCLAKNPDDRWQSAADLLHELKLLRRYEHVTAVPTKGMRRREITAWSLVLLIATVSGFVLWGERHTSDQPAKVTFELPTPATANGNQIALSPDGRNFAAVIAGPKGRPQLWVRPSEHLNALNLSGTEGAQYPFWSPDGRFIGFFADGKLRKIDIHGGPPQVLSDAPAGAGGTWNRDGVIIFAPSANGSLFRVAAGGSVVAQVTELSKSGDAIAHRFPHFLPDGNHFLYLALSRNIQESGIYVGSLNSKETKRLAATTIAEAQFAPPDLFLFMRESTALAQRFETGRLELRGDPYPIAEQVMVAGSRSAGFTVSDNGVFAYRVGAAGGANGWLVIWVDQTGKSQPLPAPSAGYENPKLSPDGKRLAIFKRDGITGDIWIIDVNTGNSSRFTFDPAEDNFPVWSPDGKQIVFASNRDGKIFNLYKKGSGGTSDDELLLKTPYDKTPFGWSADGKYILYKETDPKTKGDLWVLPLIGDRKPVIGDRKPAKLIGTSFNENSASLSSDGRWIAYDSDETGQDELYVQTFPPGERKWKVSSDGAGRSIAWRPDSKELFYSNGFGGIMAVDVTVKNGEFNSSTPRLFFQRPAIITPGRNNFDVAADGRILDLDLANQGTTLAGPQPVVLVLNWKSDLKE